MKDVRRRQWYRLALGCSIGVAMVLWVSGQDAWAQFPSQMTLKEVVNGLSRPVYMTHAGDGSGRLFVVEQRGRIRIVRDGRILSPSFLDISTLVSSRGERGLLSVAFHPRYSSAGYFFINYTDNAGDTVIARYRVSSDSDRADRSSAVVLLTVGQPFSNHNGGQLQFGPDGFLYVGMGDGGSGGDPQGNSQNPNSLLGKMLRIDVDSVPYRIPRDNPFAGSGRGRDEIWALGLRNPWRFSFDRETGDLWIADVGQDSWEEVDFQSSNSRGGENYGWNIMEGAHCLSPPAGCSRRGLTLPVAEYPTGSDCSITGGYVYRGKQNPALFGTYLFADYCSGKIWGLRRAEDGSWTARRLLDTDLNISSFGEDEEGELYVVGHRGAIYRIEKALP